MADKWLPTHQSTKMTWEAEFHVAFCWYCRIVRRTRRYKALDRHQKRRHPMPELTYIDPP